MKVIFWPSPHSGSGVGVGIANSIRYFLGHTVAWDFLGLCTESRVRVVAGRSSDSCHNPFPTLQR